MKAVKGLENVYVIKSLLLKQRTFLTGQKYINSAPRIISQMIYPVITSCSLQRIFFRTFLLSLKDFFIIHRKFSTYSQRIHLISRGSFSFTSGSLQDFFKLIRTFSFVYCIFGAFYNSEYL